MNRLEKLKSPLSVNLEITPRCNLSCFMCFASRCGEAQDPDLENLKRIIDELSKAEVFEVKLFGGEFMVYPHWREVVEYLVERDFFLTFVSNGTLFDQQSARFLLRHSTLGGGVSIHGTPEIHDSVTQVSGSYRMAIDGIRACLGEGLQISILYTLNRLNVHSILETAELLLEEGVLLPNSQFTLGRLCPYGQTKEEWQKTRLTFSDYLEVFATIEALDSQLPIEVSFGDAFPLCKLPKRYHKYVAGCWQGTGFAHIDCRGGVKACAILPGTIGNLLEEPLTEIWEKRLTEFRILSWLPQKCRTCENFCGGGCSASNIDSEIYGPDEFIVEVEKNG